MTHDPDLMQAIEDLRHVVARIRQLEAQVSDAINNPMRYNQLVAVQQDRADNFDLLRARAERLNLPPRALMLIIEEFWRLRGGGKRKPTAGSVEVAVKAALDHASIAAKEAAAEAEFSRVASARAAARLEAAVAAHDYVRAAA